MNESQRQKFNNLLAILEKPTVTDVLDYETTLNVLFTVRYKLLGFDKSFQDDLFGSRTTFWTSKRIPGNDQLFQASEGKK